MVPLSYHIQSPSLFSSLNIVTSIKLYKSSVFLHLSQPNLRGLSASFAIHNSQRYISVTIQSSPNHLLNSSFFQFLGILYYNLEFLHPHISFLSDIISNAFCAFHPMPSNGNPVSNISLPPHIRRETLEIQRHRRVTTHVQALPHADLRLQNGGSSGTSPETTARR